MRLIGAFLIILSSAACAWAGPIGQSRGTPFSAAAQGSRSSSAVLSPQQPPASPSQEAPPTPQSEVPPSQQGQTEPPKSSELSQAATATVPASNMEPAQAVALLRKVYNAAYRFGDLLTLLQPEEWKMDDAARQSFQQTVESVRAQLKTLEEWRNQFSGQPENADLGEKTMAAISELLPAINAVASAVAQYENPNAAIQYKQPGDQLADLQQSLKSYLAYLRARVEQTHYTSTQPPGPRSAGAATSASVLQTEQVNAPPAPAVPLTTTSMESPPMSSAQVKALLYKIYAPAYRVQDLLSQEHPERWKLPDEQQHFFNEARDALQSRLAELERWRSQLSQQPDNMDSAFQTYVALNAVLAPLETVSRSVTEYEDPKLGMDYSRRERELASLRQDLVPYISYLLRSRDQTVQMFQTNLANCQNQLGYAMHSPVEPATPMVNVNPVFQGHRHIRRANHKTAPTRTRTKKKTEKAGAS